MLRSGASCFTGLSNFWGPRAPLDPACGTWLSPSIWSSVSCLERIPTSARQCPPAPNSAGVLSLRGCLATPPPVVESSSRLLPAWATSSGKPSRRTPLVLEYLPLNLGTRATHARLDSLCPLHTHTHTHTHTHARACTHTTYTSLSRALLLWLVLEGSLQQLPAKLPGSSTSSPLQTVSTLLRLCTHTPFPIPPWGRSLRTPGSSLRPGGGPWTRESRALSWVLWALNRGPHQPVSGGL